MPEENIMKYENVLPVEFDGVFKFTNWSKEEFIGTWGKKQYHFASETTSPMIIPEHSPLEIQNIRKKFARDLAEREFYKSDKYTFFMKQERNSDGTAKLNSIHSSVAYTIDDLKEGIQACLKPLGIKRAFVESVQETPLEDTLSRNDEGDLNSVAVDKKTSLREKALKGKGVVDN